ncbi:MAG: SAM-dependent methyltransferase, partial [Bryobacteraceae bacterium]
MNEELQREYALRFEATADYRRRVWSVLTRGFLKRWIAPDATVLDLGCGWGEFINQIQAGRKYGMDLNPEAERKVAPGVTVLMQDCS